MDEIEGMKKHQVDHLILLIGSNPLPNYVIMSLLVKPGGQIHLVHSVDTMPFAERIAEKAKQMGFQYKLIPVEESDPYLINTKIQEVLRDKKGSIGLNYTGGTKAMAVNAFHAATQSGLNVEYSYLDARSLRLRFHSKDASGEVISIRDCKVEFLTLLGLHGLTYETDPEKYAFQPEFARALAQLPEGQWRDWCDKNLRDEKTKKLLKFEEISGITLPDYGDLYSLVGGSITLGELAQKWGKHPKNSKERKANFIGNWLDGLWLEDYTLACLRSISEQFKLHDILLNVQPRERDFQFDVVCMRGYQLYALSCSTTGDTKLVKSKLFELYIRAQQMGGEEARAGLICGAGTDDHGNYIPQKVQHEIENEWEATRGKVRVFGAEELSNLPDSLSHWFQNS